MSYNLVDPTTGDLTLVAGRNAIDDGSVSNSKVWSSRKVSDELEKKVDKDLANATGTLAVANGGTGKTTEKDAVNAFINSLDIGTSDPQDADYYVSQYAGGGTTNTAYYRRPVSSLWNYIKGKISSVLGLTKDTYGGKSASAGTADKATNDGNGNNIVDTYALKSNLQYIKSINIRKVDGSSDTSYYLIAKTPSSNEPGNIDSIFVNGSDFMNRMFEGSIRTRAGNYVFNYGKNNLPIEIYEQTDGTINVYWLVSDAYNRVALNITATEIITTYGGNLSPVTPTGSKMTLTEYDYKSYRVLPVARGGTGATTAKGAQNALLSDMQTETTAIDDSTEFVMKYGTPTDTKGALFKRSATLVWNYIKDKISSVLGLTATAYGGKASTAEIADKTVNDITLNIPYVTESGQYVIPLGNIPEPTSTAPDSPYNWDITGFFSIIRPAGHAGGHITFEAGHGYSHSFTTYAYLDEDDFTENGTTRMSIKAFQYNGKWWLGLWINTQWQGYTSKMTVTYSRGLPATPTCILYNSSSDGVANEEIYNSIQDIPSSWWRRRAIYNPTTFIQNITAPNITSLEERVTALESKLLKGE